MLAKVLVKIDKANFSQCQEFIQEINELANLGSDNHKLNDLLSLFIDEHFSPTSSTDTSVIRQVINQKVLEKAYQSYNSQAPPPKMQWALTYISTGDSRWIASLSAEEQSVCTNLKLVHDAFKSVPPLHTLRSNQVVATLCMCMSRYDNDIPKIYQLKLIL